MVKHKSNAFVRIFVNTDFESEAKCISCNNNYSNEIHT